MNRFPMKQCQVGDAQVKAGCVRALWVLKWPLFLSCAAK